jgi:hypothetical protein
MRWASHYLFKRPKPLAAPVQATGNIDANSPKYPKEFEDQIKKSIDGLLLDSKWARKVSELSSTT